MDKRQLTGGFVFDIQGFSLHDGPGCRTLIFFKGCPLHCAWCSNPEGIRPFPEPLYDSSKCLARQDCIRQCPRGALSWQNQQLNIDKSACGSCESHDCVNVCLSGALRMCGNYRDVEDVMDKIRRDRSYWGGGGGITLTGGEPFLQPGLATYILKACYESYIHTAVETCGHIAWKHYEQAIPYVDWIFYDLKHINSAEHQKMTGIGNELILENARKLAASFNGRLIFRMPVIPGFNDEEDTIREMACFIKETGRDEVNILPLHHLGREKYNLLDEDYRLKDISVPGEEALNTVAQTFNDCGIRCYTGSTTPF
jgi:pyruvate formate lyase activating enzyme